MHGWLHPLAGIGTLVAVGSDRSGFWGTMTLTKLESLKFELLADGMDVSEAARTRLAGLDELAAPQLDIRIWSTPS